MLVTSINKNSFAGFSSSTMVVDLETTGLNPDGKDEICGIACLDPKTGASAYFPFRHMIGKTYLGSVCPRWFLS